MAKEGAPFTAAMPRATSETIHVIERRGGWSAVDWGEIWRYRELLYFLTWRDVRVRYKQTVLGALWALLQPLATMVVFALFFGRLAGLGTRTGGVPYPLFVYLGLLPWTFFASSIAASSVSLVGSAQLITKVYFPRLIVPLSTIGVSGLDLLVSLLLLGGMMAYYGVEPSWRLLLAPVFLIFTVVAAVGVGSLLAALTALYRDFRFVVPFMMQIWMFLSPVIYPSAIVPERWRNAYFLNPAAGLLDGFRAACLDQAFDWPHVGLSMGITLALAWLGTRYFYTIERRLADVI